MLWGTGCTAAERQIAAAALPPPQGVSAMGKKKKKKKKKKNSPQARWVLVAADTCIKIYIRAEQTGRQRCFTSAVWKKKN